MNKLSLGFALLVSVLLANFNCTESRATILPRNHLDRYDRMDETSNITEKQFHAIVDHIVEMWKPLAELHHAKLVASADWKDSTVNAFAEQSGNTWSVHFFGGLARRPEITPDGFALVVCHELGHHFGGYAFYEGRGAWAAAEGQADYWATEVCGRRIWSKSPNNERHIDAGSPAEEKCAASWSDPDKKALCTRILDGGLSLAKLLSKIGTGGEPTMSTKDTSKVSKTSTAHPRAQCRLDTYIAGALCTKKFDLKVIPGKEVAGGPASSEAEKEAAKYSCFDADKQEGASRPRCWFKPQTESFSNDLATVNE